MVPQVKLAIPTTALLLGISQDKGIDHYIIEPKSITDESFAKYLKAVHKQAKGRRLALFMDNMKVHKSESTV